MIRAFVRKSPDVRYLTDDRALELDGVRDGVALWHPGGEFVDPERALVATSRGTVVGFDLVVAAPRSISCLLAVGSDDEQRALVRAHRGAVAASMEYLDRRAAVVRYQVGDEPHYAHARLRPRASFTHGINRAMEPHLHDHVLVAGRARGVDRQLDSRSLLRHLRAADALYRAQLRHDLFEATGRTVWRYFSGRESVQGVGEGVIALWPGRSDERPPKASPSREQVTARWREQHSHALDVPAMAAPVWERGEVHHHSVMASISQRDQVGRADLVEAVANASVLGAPARDVESAVDRLFPELGRDRGLATRELSHGDVRRRLVQLEDRTRELQRSSRPLERSREGRSRVG